MTNRILLGNKGTELGLWISKTGIDVMAATDFQLMISTKYKALQIIQSGTFNMPSTATGVTITTESLDNYLGVIVLLSQNDSTWNTWCDVKITLNPTSIVITPQAAYAYWTNPMTYNILNLRMSD